MMRFKNGDEAIEYIHSLKWAGKKDALVKIKRLLELLDNPQKKLKFVHIAGTNGKGSTTVMLSSVLRAAGYKTGTFISPFVLDFTERMQIDGVPIDKSTLAEITAEVREKIEILSDEMGCLSEFEAVAAIGFLWFARCKCDVVCLEVGLGGRCDPTNIIDSPLAAVITPIGLDHTEYLGDTVEKIAAEKAGIIKPNCSAVCCAEQHPDALAVIMQRCAELGVTLTTAGAGIIDVKSKGVLGSDVAYMNTDIHLPLGGAHQLQNLTTALAAVEVLRQKGFSIDAGAVKKGVESVSFPARMEKLCSSPTVILDGGHNPHGMAAVANAADELPLPRILVLGMLADKDTDAALGIIVPHFDKIITVSVETTPRGLAADELCEKALAFNKNVTAVQSHSEALSLAKDLAGAGGSVLICGSLYLAGEIRPLLI